MPTAWTFPKVQLMSSRLRQMIERPKRQVKFVSIVPRIERPILVAAGTMAPPQHFLVAGKAVAVGLALVAAAACRFVVDQSGEWRPDHAIAGGRGAQAEVDIVVRDAEVLFVEAADRRNARARNQHAGAGHRGQRLPHMQPRHRARIALALPAEPVPSQSAQAHNNAGVLQSPVRINQARANDAGSGIIEATHHLPQPAAVDHLDVVIQEQHELARGTRKAAIDLARKIKRRRLDLGREWDRPLPGFGIELQYARIGGAVVDHHDFEVRVIGFDLEVRRAAARSVQTNPGSE